jgi:acyl-CoA thioesterase
MTEYEELPVRFKEALLSKTKANSPFWQLLDMDLIDVKKGYAKTKIPYSKKLHNANGVIHGGVIFSAADTAVALALVGLVDRRDVLTTIEMKINYLKPFESGEIIAEAKIIHKGTQTAIGDVDIRDSNGSLVAKAISTYAIIKKTTETR